MRWLGHLKIVSDGVSNAGSVDASPLFLKDCDWGSWGFNALRDGEGEAGTVI